MENAGAGELLITSINREGSEAGLDLHLFQKKDLKDFMFQY